MGDRVAVLAVKQDTTLLARRVLVIPAKPVRQQLSGTVTKVEGDTVTITDKDGNTFTAQLPRGRAAKVKVGDVITMTLLKTPGVEKYIAGGLMRGEDLRQRLNGFIDKVKGRKADTESQKSKQSDDLNKLEKLLQTNMEHQREVLQRVIDKAPAQAREALEKAKEEARRGWEESKSALEKARGKSGSRPTP